MANIPRFRLRPRRHRSSQESSRLTAFPRNFFVWFAFFFVAVRRERVYGSLVHVRRTDVTKWRASHNIRRVILSIRQIYPFNKKTMSELCDTRQPFLHVRLSVLTTPSINEASDALYLTMGRVTYLSCRFRHFSTRAGAEKLR